MAGAQGWTITVSQGAIGSAAVTGTRETERRRCIWTGVVFSAEAELLTFPARHDPTRSDPGCEAPPGPSRSASAGYRRAPLLPDYRSCGLSGSESAQPRAPNGLGRSPRLRPGGPPGPRRTRPRGSDTDPVRGPIPGGPRGRRPLMNAALTTWPCGYGQRRRGGPEPSLRWSGGPARQRRARRPRSHDHRGPNGPGRRKPRSRPSHDRVKPPSYALPGEQLTTQA